MLPSRSCLPVRTSDTTPQFGDEDGIGAHGEVLVIINDDFELFPERLDCQAHTATTISSQLAQYAFDHLAQFGPGERIAEFAARVKQRAVACKFTAGDQQPRLEDRFISVLQNSGMVSAILRLKDEDITFSSAVETASAIEQTLKDVRAIAGQSMTGDPGVHAISQAPKAACTVFGAGRGQTSQRGDRAAR